jgi:predicted NAD/FAD-dependent oxidoreductase
VESGAAPAVWDGMRAAGQVPSFALMLTVASSAGAPLFPFEGAAVVGDGVVGWIANDSSKPGRVGHSLPGVRLLLHGPYRLSSIEPCFDAQ